MTVPVERLSGAAVGLPHPFDRTRALKAVLFDVDGTLYTQSRLRALMALELMTLPLAAPSKAAIQWRTLAAYRRAQETLRCEVGPVNLRTQMATTAARAGVPVREVERLVEEWMFQRPLKYLPYCEQAGLRRVLDLLERRAVRTGVLTDYPATSKLRAMGLANRFSPVLCTTDPEIGRFKPDPAGFLAACARWQLPPENVLMVGDRVEVDAAGAAAAGMASVIIGWQRSSIALPPKCLRVPSFERLHDVLAGRA